MGALNIPVQVKTATASGQTPTSLLSGELGLDPWLGRLWWADNNGNKQFAALPSIAANSSTASDVAINTQNILYQGLLIAAMRNVPTGLVDGILDPFSSLADVNASTSSGYTFANVTTPANVSTGANATSSSNGNSTTAAGSVTAAGWQSGESGTGVTGVSYIGQDFGAGAAQAIVQIVYTAGTNTGQAVSSVYLEYADGGKYTSLGTFPLNTAASAVTTIAVPAGAGSHRQWRLRAAVAPVTSGYAWSLTSVIMSIGAGGGTIGATVTAAQADGAVQSGSYAVANGAASGYPASGSFDGSSGTWISNEAGSGVNGVSWIGQDFGAGNAKAITSIVVTTDSRQTAYIVSSVYLEYADGGAYTTVGTYSITVASSTATTITVPSGTGAHRQWRLRAAASPQSSWAAGQIVMKVAGASASTAAMVLQSATLASAVASPSAMRALLQVDSTSAALTPNTDITVALSRDGGNTFTTGTLATVQSMPDGTVVLDTGWVSVTGQPAGNSTMTYLCKTPTQKAAVLTGISMMVRP